jgi:hypothetical protein
MGVRENVLYGFVEFRIGISEVDIQQDLYSRLKSFITHIALQLNGVPVDPVRQPQQMQIGKVLVIIVPKSPQQFVDLIMHELQVQFDDIQPWWRLDSTRTHKVLELTQQPLEHLTERAVLLTVAAIEIAENIVVVNLKSSVELFNLLEGGFGLIIGSEGCVNVTA